ncbi:MAG: type II toxin-antitoxin system RelE/ParE family toxin [bacterium]|nr:type II toxin-antitoxin system RelE/ParE family toxin [bacterium]
MIILKTKIFARWARREHIKDSMRFDAVERAEKGLIDADLGGGVVKQRIARRGKGKSGGYRTVLLYRCGHRAVYVYGFAKNEKDNISPLELDAFKQLAAVLLKLSHDEIREAITNGAIVEVKKVDQSENV